MEINECDPHVHRLESARSRVAGDNDRVGNALSHRKAVHGHADARGA
jgi:hypothetical protein